MKGIKPLASDHGTAQSMRANRRTDTKPEVLVRKALHAQGLRFRKDLVVRVGTKQVRPDIVFTRRKVAVFLDGCWWHDCPVHGQRPLRNRDFWNKKFEDNRLRDEFSNRALLEGGWLVVRAWEHEDVTDVVTKVVAALELSRLR